MTLFEEIQLEPAFRQMKFPPNSKPNFSFVCRSTTSLQIKELLCVDQNSSSIQVALKGGEIKRKEGNVLVYVVVSARDS